MRKPASPLVLKKKIRHSIATREVRAAFHGAIADLVRGGNLNAKQAGWLIERINSGRLRLADAHLLLSYLDIQELKRITNIMGHPRGKQARRTQFYEEELPRLLELAGKRAAASAAKKP